MPIRLLKIEDLDEAFSIVLDAKELLSSLSKQWQQGYPYKETIEKDINNGDMYGYFEGKHLLGIMAIVKGFNPDYETIEGAWDYPTGHRDFTIHRIAVRKGHHGRHIGDLMMKFAMDYAKENGFVSVKADTHVTNKAMQKLCLNAGMQYKGTIYLVRNEEDNARLAYEASF